MRTRRQRWAVVSVVLCVQLGIGAPLGAQEPSQAVVKEAREWTRRALDLRRQERNAEALECFRKAHELRPTPTTQAQIGITLASLGDFVAAERHLLKALGNTEHPFIRKNQPVLRETVERVRAHLATLSLAGGPEGAELLINERRAGTLPLAAPLRVVRGRVVVEVRAHGYLPYTRVLDLGGQESAALQLTLQRLDMATPRTPPAAAAPSAPADNVARRSARKIAGFTLLGASGLMLAMGIAGLSVAEDRGRTYNNSGCPDNPGDDLCMAVDSEYKLGRNLGIAGFATGAALGLAGAGLLLWPRIRARMRRASGSPAVRAAAQRLDCTPQLGLAAGGVNVSCRLRF